MSETGYARTLLLFPVVSSRSPAYVNSTRPGLLPTTMLFIYTDRCQVWHERGDGREEMDRGRAWGEGGMGIRWR